ncbi:MAG: prephenate dehydrogenase/arogenate dehydrogenase family protein [Bacteroidetes bacterium]|nr:prephenate dehydrogenase/arogenate dehydrogenase family protein [Bacteroidota bacterium]
MKNISIIGLGLIGGSIAKALKPNLAERKKDSSQLVIKGFDKKEILDEALKDKSIDEALNSIDEAKFSDVIFLCLPTELSLNYFIKLAPQVADGTIITDVCGIKGIFEDEWKKLESKGSYIGGHPMTGKETSGYKSSDPLLFENSVYIVSESSKGNKKLEEFLNLIKSLGARIRFLDPYLHDKVIARVSHLPQLLSIALVNSVSENGNFNYLDFAAGGFRDMTRIASSSFNIWESVLKLNHNAIIDSIDVLIKNLNQIEDQLKQEDLKSLEASFQKARTRRDEIPKNTKGFINPLVDIFIYVKDEPGVLSKLTTLLFNNNINIKDLELLKIREGTGGTFRISFESEEIALKAKEIMEKSGFITK